MPQTTDQSRLNYEEQNQHKICIQFSNHSEVIEKNFSINIEDINEPPYNLQCSNQTGICTVFDDDFNQTLKFQMKPINSLDNETLFEIICTDNGQPSLSVSTHIKTLPDDMTLIFVPIFLLIVRVDDDSNTIDKLIRDNIVILYSNDGDKTEQRQRQRRQLNSSPQDIYFNISHLSVPENSQNSEIAHVYVVDEDNDNYTCSIYTYNIPRRYQPFEIVNRILRTKLTTNNTNYALDFERMPAYDTTVSCSDLIHHFTISKNFTIAVSDVNEAPVALTLTSNILPENSPIGYVIGQLETIDPDKYSVNQTFQYTIVTDLSHAFTLENDKLILTRENVLDMCISQPDLCPHDYEQTTSLRIRILVEDNGVPQASQKFWILIRITDENDPPLNLQLDKNIVMENSPIGTLIGSFSVEDQDLYQIHTYTLLNQSSFSSTGHILTIEDNGLRLLRSPDYEQEQFVLITVQATDNGIPPKNITNVFLIEIRDIDELPNTYIFIPNIDNIISNDTINNLINEINPIQTNYLPQNAYFQSSLGQIIFLIEDRDRDINLYGYDGTLLNELGFSKPTCTVLTQIPYRLLCKSIVTIANPHSVYDNNDYDGHLVVTLLTLTSNNKTITFSKPLRIKFENISLTINNQEKESIYIPKYNSTSFIIGSINAIDVIAAGQPVANVRLNENSSLSYPLEIVNSTILKVLDDVDFSSSNLSLIFNVSVLVTTTGENIRVVEKRLTVYVKDPNDFNFTLSNNKTMENSHENTSIGNFIIENGIDNYTIILIDDANERFKLNGTNLLTAKKYIEHCHLNQTCPLNHETEPIINITVAVYDQLTNQILRFVTFPIEIEDENETPYNLTLSSQFVPENTTIGSTIGIINAMDIDSNQTLTYTTTTTNSIFTIIDNRLILNKKLNYDKRQFIPIIIRATDNGQPPTFTENLFIINVTSVNGPSINVTSDLMTVNIPQNSTSLIVGLLRIIDPDVNENFTITFDKPNYQALLPAKNSYSIIADDDYELMGQIYYVSIVDLDPPRGQDQANYFVNVTANITDVGGYSVTHEFRINYVLRRTTNLTTTSTRQEMEKRDASLLQALHIRIYETTPPNTPIVRGLLRSSSFNNSLSNLPTCTAIDDQGYSFIVNTTNTNQLAFIIFLPDNYTLNSTTDPTIIINVKCRITNDTNVDQDIVIDVLPAPPTIQINFNQTKTFYATNTINNDTILGTFNLIELTTIPTNRTYDLSLVNNQDIFQLLPNGSLIQIGQYPSDILKFDNPKVDLIIQAIETTPDTLTRLIQKTFSVPIIVNSSIPTITFSQSSISNNTNPNTTIGHFTIHNISIPYQLELIDTYNNSLELSSDRNNLILKKPINTIPLINNRTQLQIKVALINTTNETILTTIFPLRIIYPIIIDSCLNKDCGNGTCIPLDETLSYCLCTAGYRGIDCRRIDSCAYSPCTYNSICHQLSSEGNFSCQCLPNYSGIFCEIPIDICQVNKSSCPSTDICIPIYNNLTNFFACISRDELQYFVFDYLNDYKNIDIVDDENFPKKFQDFINNTLLLTENIILPETKILGPHKYNRAQLISVAVQMSNESFTTLNNALEIFCINQSLIMDLFAREICSGYQQAIYLDKYFKSTPDFCPNCTFIEAADKYYWFDNIIPYLPLLITIIIASLLIAAIPFISFNSNTPKKVTLPLMKAMKGPEHEEIPTLIKSVRSAAKISCYSYRERNDSGYESNEDTDNYIEEIITNYQQEFYVYPVSSRPRSISMERQGTTIDDLISQNNNLPSRSTNFSRNSRRYVQRSVSMSPQKLNRQSSINNSQTLKPIIQRRPTLFNSSLGSLIHLTGTPRLNYDDDTYVSTTFRNENTSKFVIGTLWNTFALVNNLFLQRPRNRRNAISGDSNIRAVELARLEQLYSFAERDQANELPTNNLESIFTDVLSQSKRHKTNHLQSIIFDMLSSPRQHHCNCYGNHHLPTCIYYDHSVPYVRRFPGSTSQLETVFHDVHKLNRPHRQDAGTQSYIEKPLRIFTHIKPTTNVSTQYSPIRDKNSTELNLKKKDDKYYYYDSIDVSTQTIEHKKNSLNDISTQFSPIPIDDNKDMNFLYQPKSRTNIYDDRIYANVSTQFSPTPVENISSNFKSQIINDMKIKHTNASTQFSPIPVEDISTQYYIEEIKDKKPKYTNNLTQLNSKINQDNTIHDQKNLVMNELKQILSSSTSKESTIHEEKSEKKSPPPHSVRSLVSMFETTSLPKKLNINSQPKSFTNLTTNSRKLISPLDSKSISMGLEEVHSSIAHDVIEQYANEVASNIVDNAVLTAITTTVYHNEQEQQPRRFSFYNNSGGHGKSLLFQSNTFVPSNGTVNQEEIQDFRAESAASSTLLNDPLVSTMPLNTEDESQHTLIVGRYVDGNDSKKGKTRQRRSLTVDTKFDLSSSSSSVSLNDEQINHQQYLSNSQLFSAHELYIRPWLIRRATLPNIHCLDNNLNDTRVEAITTTTPTTINSLDMFFNIFPNNHNLDLFTRFTCLITILLYLDDVHDENSNKILYDELNQIEKQFINEILTPSKINTNVFQTINPDGSKRYRTGFILDINPSNTKNIPKIFSKQIEWKRVKIITRRFRKKYQHYKQLIKNDQKKISNQSNIENYFKYFDTTSKRRMKKYAKHYAEKL
ncbi:unnamed protein product [Rotaria sordida]|uniref:Cadherin n=1 Tax=Rotaria sordida TaxID=392033 RepID=A0A814QQ37_9BILA|nr:unnamed protein product [Rotaria sordida]CAF3598270.1 unnamed protein product [Rotaria sordida]